MSDQYEYFDRSGRPVKGALDPAYEYFDTQGNPIGLSSKDKPGLNLQSASDYYLGPKPGLKIPVLPEEDFISKTARAAGDLLPVAGGIAGAVLGRGQAGKFAGTSLGTFGGSILQQLGEAPAIGKEPPSLSGMSQRAATEAIANIILDPLLGHLAGSIFKGPTGRTALMKKLSPGTQKFMAEEPEVAAFMQLHPELKTTVGQTGGGPIVNLVENISTPIAKRQIVAEQQGILKSIWDQRLQNFGLGTPLELAQKVKQASQAGFDAVRDATNDSYGQLRAIAGRFNTIKHGFSDVQGPVFLDKSSGPLDKIFSTIKSDPELKAVADVDKPIYDMIKQIGELRYPDGSVRPINIEEAIKLKSLLGARSKYGELTVEGKVLPYRDLNRVVDEDILRSINGQSGNPTRPGWKLKSDALEGYRKGNALTERKYALFGEEAVPEIHRLLEDPTKTISNVHAIKDPQILDRLMAGAAFGDPARKEIVRKSIASNYLQNLLQDSWDTELKRFDPNKPIKWFVDRENQDIIRRLFTANERADFTYLFKTIQHLDPRLPMAGVTAAGIRGLGALATFVPGTITGLATGDVSRGVQTTGAILGVLVGANTFSHAVLLNPKVARAAANMMRLPPMSADAKIASRVLYTALKGAQVELIGRDGAIYGTGTIGQDGKVKPSREFAPQLQPSRKEPWLGYAQVPE